MLPDTVSPLVTSCPQERGQVAGVAPPLADTFSAGDEGTAVEELCSVLLRSNSPKHTVLSP